VIQSPRYAVARPALAGRRPTRFGFARFAALGALVAALGLAGCGRKGGLDTPPMAATGDLQASGQPGPAPATAGKPVAPAPEKQKTFLDWLID
jgi:predicted small lipoprotein YifL